MGITNPIKYTITLLSSLLFWLQLSFHHENNNNNTIIFFYKHIHKHIHTNIILHIYALYIIFMSVEYSHIYGIFCPTKVICIESGNKHVVWERHKSLKWLYYILLYDFSAYKVCRIQFRCDTDMYRSDKHVIIGLHI